MTHFRELFEGSHYKTRWHGVRHVTLAKARGRMHWRTTPLVCHSAGYACRRIYDGKTGAFSLCEFGVCHFVTITTAYRTGDFL